MVIGPMTIAEIERTIEALFAEHAENINEAYLKSDDEEPSLSISISVKLEPGKSGIDIDTTMSFVVEKIKTKVVSHADEKQQNLFDEDEQG